MSCIEGHNFITLHCHLHRYADGEEYRRKAGCQNITALFCDLTEETPAILDGDYYARVFANGKPHGFIKTRFTPLARSKNPQISKILTHVGAKSQPSYV